MRDPDRMEPLVKMLLEYWQKHGNTDQRLGQLLINLMRDADYPSTSDAGPQLFNLEDEALFDMLDEMLDKEDPAAPKPPAGSAGISAAKITASSISAKTLHVPSKPKPSSHSSGTSVAGWTPVSGTGGGAMFISPPSADEDIERALGRARRAAMMKKTRLELMKKMRKDGRA